MFGPIYVLFSVYGYCGIVVLMKLGNMGIMVMTKTASHAVMELSEMGNVWTHHLLAMYCS